MNLASQGITICFLDRRDDRVVSIVDKWMLLIPAWQWLLIELIQKIFVFSSQFLKLSEQRFEIIFLTTELFGY